MRRSTSAMFSPSHATAILLRYLGADGVRAANIHLLVVIILPAPPEKPRRCFGLTSRVSDPIFGKLDFGGWSPEPGQLLVCA